MDRPGYSGVKAVRSNRMPGLTRSTGERVVYTPESERNT
jgi:hypothetical protein